jgi:hypothetical protein
VTPVPETPVPEAAGAKAAPLTVSQPYPAPRELPPRYPRHRPDLTQLRAAVLGLVDGPGWAGLSWRDLIEALLAIGRTDVPLARLSEGHVDAVRILGQVGRTPAPGALYGVWASRSQRTGVGARVAADGFVVDGTLRFASGTGVVDRALVPAWLDDEHHLLLDLDVADLPSDPTAWKTTAMELSRSHTVEIRHCEVAAAAQVGEVNFYLSRPAFFPGGVGVAACWAGGAARLADRLHARLSGPVAPQLQARLGRIRTDLVVAAAAVRGAADRLDVLLPRGWPRGDRGPAVAGEGGDWQGIATEARAVVGDAVARVLEETRRIAGPAGLAFDEELGRARADLDLYVLQQSSDGDAFFLGARPGSGR